MGGYYPLLTRPNVCMAPHTGSVGLVAINQTNSMNRMIQNHFTIYIHSSRHANICYKMVIKKGLKTTKKGVSLSCSDQLQQQQQCMLCI